MATASQNGRKTAKTAKMAGASKSCAKQNNFFPRFFYLLLPIPTVESWYKKERKMMSGSSDCCGAPVHFQDICSRCGEHCEVIEDSDDGYDAARDAYNLGYGPPVTQRQWDEELQLRDEYRRNGW